MSMHLLIQRTTYEAVVQHLLSVYPEEGCGLLASVDSVICRHFPIENTLHSSTAYQMHPQQQIEAFFAIEKMGEVAGIYHSHPHSPAIPSLTDIAQATYPHLPIFIISFAQPQPYLAVFSLNPMTKTPSPIPFQILNS